MKYKKVLCHGVNQVLALKIEFCYGYDSKLDAFVDEVVQQLPSIIDELYKNFEVKK